LRLELEAAHFGSHSAQAAEKTQEIEHSAGKAGGSGVARDVASIPYEVPTDLMPAQLYTLGVSYFKAHEDEKAAMIFTFLTGLKDSDAFKTPKNFLMTGVAWYRVDNYAKADQFFDKVIQLEPADDNLQLQAHARLWKAMAASRMGKHSKAQFWLNELMDHHPHSPEAGWVNGKTHPATEAHRGVASEH
jgi:outer membrane protein assembly factor BamD (BamD/ComL family)